MKAESGSSSAKRNQDTKIGCATRWNGKSRKRGKSMTSSQIARSYREAKDKKKQIGILAELAHMTKAQIEKILIDEGETLPGAVGRPRKVPAKSTTAKKTEEALKKKAAAVKEEPPKVVDGITVAPYDNTTIIPGTDTHCVCAEEETPFRKVRELPEGVYNALHKELESLRKETAELIRRQDEIVNFLYEES